MWTVDLNNISPLFEIFPVFWHLREHSNSRRCILDAFCIRE
jgi:hypothetical protein